MLQVSRLVFELKTYLESHTKIEELLDKEKHIKQYYLPLFNLGNYKPFRALTVGLFKQLKEADPRAVSPVYMKKLNEIDEKRVS